MQTFLNTATGNYHQYDADVVLDIPSGTWSTPSGAKGTCPTTLTPYTGPWPIPPTVAQAQTDQIATLRTACANAIAGGFSSSALGSAYSYPSDPISQSNMNTIAGSPSGGSLWCGEGGVWTLKAHTQSQAQAVLAAFVTWLNACQSQLATLTAEVNAATTVAAVQAITWTAP
jgi:hypothetical protein